MPTSLPSQPKALGLASRIHMPGTVLAAYDSVATGPQLPAAKGVQACDPEVSASGGTQPRVGQLPPTGHPSSRWDPLPKAMEEGRVCAVTQAQL